MQYTTKRFSWKTWFKPERNWKLFANSDFLKSYTPGWLRRVIHIRLTLIYGLNGFGFTWLKRKSYWKIHSYISCLLLWTVEKYRVAYTLRGFSIFFTFNILKGSQLSEMLPNPWHRWFIPLSMRAKAIQLIRMSFYLISHLKRALLVWYLLCISDSMSQ